MGSGHEALRRGRWSEAGRIYLLTFTTANRQPHFLAWPIASDAARLMTGLSLWRKSRLLAWVLMPDHWHGLVELGDGMALAECVGRLKGASARALRQQHPALDRIWAPGYHDHALRREEDLLPAARYLIMNPVRAGLVSRPGDYPFWDAGWLQDSV
ncbi:transposase [Luteimonas soli]|uniref:Transposase n=1 Tax=Luteimonas soli TaxID=1648966 RepID=A0ABV7XL31_9GAMM